MHFLNKSWEEVRAQFDDRTPAACPVELLIAGYGPGSRDGWLGLARAAAMSAAASSGGCSDVRVERARQFLDAPLADAGILSSRRALVG